MGTSIRNDTSNWHPIGTATSMVIDATNNEVDTDIDVALAVAAPGAHYFQIQVLSATEGAYFTVDGSDPTSGTTRFQVDLKFSEIWSISTLRNSRWARHTTDGTLTIQGVGF